MTSADFFESINSEWKQMDVVPGVSVEGARKKKQRALYVLAGEVCLSLITIAAAFYFWSLQLGFLFNISGLVLFASGIHALLVNHRIAMPVVDWSDWSPQGLLEYQVELCNSAINKARYIIVSCIVLIAFTVFIILTALSRRELVPEYFEWLYASITLPIVLALGLWARWRIRSKSREYAQYKTLLEEFVAARNSEA